MVENEDKKSKEEQIDSIDIEIKRLKEKRQDLANNTTKESINLSKFGLGMTSLFNPVLWLKDFCSIFNFRKLLIYGAVVGIIFFTGYMKAWKNKPILVNCKDSIIETTVQTGIERGDILRIETTKGKMYYQFLRKNGINSAKYPITQKDLPKLKTYGIHFKPKLFLGFGTGGPSVGAGAELAYLYRFNLDIFGMSDRAFYVGISYDIDNKPDGLLENSSLGIAVGKSIENVNDNRIMIYWSIKF